MPILSGFPTGGAGELNFSVVAYASEDARPATAEENTIAVITTTPITGYLFSADEPANPIEGHLWISTGVESPVAFNALKGNTIMIYPLQAKQYVGGAWVSVDAMRYQSGTWSEWVRRVYLTSEVWEPVLFYDIDGYTTTTGVFSNDVYSVTLTGANKSGSISTREKIKIEASDKTIVVEVFISQDRSTGGDFRLLLSTSKGWNGKVVSVTVTGAYNGEVSLDVSDVSGDYYLLLGNAQWDNFSGVECRCSNVRIFK